MAKKIVQSTERGQITLPKEWRKKFGTNSYLMHMDENKLTVVPLNLEDMAGEEYFSALAESRDTPDAKFVSHKEAWKNLRKK